MDNAGERQAAIASTIGGKIYGLDWVTGKVFWIVDLPAPLVSVSSYSADTASTYLVEPVRDGQIYVAFPGSPIKRLPFTMRRLIEMSPFRALDGTLYLGSKKTEILEVDTVKGIIRRVFKPDSAAGHRGVGGVQYIDTASSLKSAFLAKTQYTLLIFGSEDVASPKWQVSFTRYHSADYGLRKVADYRLIPGFDGSLMMWNIRSNSLVWSRYLGSAVVSIMSTSVNDAGNFVLLDEASDDSSVFQKGQDVIGASNLRNTLYISTHRDVPFVLNSADFHYIQSDDYDNDDKGTEASGGAALVPYLGSTSPVKNICSLDCYPGAFGFPQCLIGTHSINPIRDVLVEIDHSINDSPLLIAAPSPNPYLPFVTLIIGALLAVSVLWMYQSRLRMQSPAVQVKFSKDAASSTSIARELIVSEEIIGYGSNGTVVFTGKLQGRTVAVKRLLAEFYFLAEHEIALLLHSDDHANVIRYHFLEKTNRFIYIALDHCRGSLYDVFDSESDRYHMPQIVDFRNSHSKLNCMADILAGIRHLHSLNIVHRDIKPHNILINYGTGNDRLVISDFGLCKKLGDQQMSYMHSVTNGAGSHGWRAPEILAVLSPTESDSDLGHLHKLSMGVDVFAAGLVFFFIMSEGDHAYGEHLLRENNIVNDQKFLGQLHSENPVECHLIERMLEADSKKRPTAAASLEHIAFWSPSRRLSFLLDLSDRLDAEDRDGELYQRFQALGRRVISKRGWMDKVDQELFHDLGKYRKYDKDSLADLLRAIRNKKHHYQELPTQIKQLFGSIPEGYYEYFRKRFPKLDVVAYQFVDETELFRSDQLMRPYFAVS